MSKNPSLGKSFQNALKFFLPDEIVNKPSGLREKQVEALNQNRALSDLLHYRTYEPVEAIKVGGEQGGLYRMMGGRYGIVYKINPPPYITEEFENVINSFLSKIMHNHTVVHITTHASQNIKNFVDSYVETCNYRGVNVKNPGVLDYIVDAKIKSFKNWKVKSISSRADIRLRNFNNMISVLFPKDVSMHAIVSQCNELAGVLEAFKPSCLAPTELVPILKEIVNPDLEDYNETFDVHRAINKQIAKGSHVRISDDESYIKIGKKRLAKAFTTEKFPEVLQPLDFQSAFMSPFNEELQTAIPGSFLMSLSIVFDDPELEAKRVKSKAQHNIGQYASLPYIVEKKYPIVKDKRIENEDAVYYIDKLGEPILRGDFKIVIFEDNREDLERISAGLVKRFADIDGVWKIKAESYSIISFMSMVYGLPLIHSAIGVDTLRRHDYMFRSNNSQIAPLISDFKGFGRAHLTYVGRTGQAQRFEPLMNSQTNYNFIITGPMGSGKSFFMNDFLMQSLRAGFKIRMIDIGRSYLPVCETVGGQYLEFVENNTICMNFFTNLKTQIIEVYDELAGRNRTVETPHEDEYASIIPLIGMMAGVSLSYEMKEATTTVTDELDRKNIVIAVEDAIRVAFMRYGRVAGMREVYSVMEDMREKAKGVSESFYIMFDKLVYSLTDYSLETGKYYKYFNGANNINFESDYFILELEELLQTKKELLPVVTLATLQRIGSEAFLDDKTPMVIGIDEARHALSNPLFASALDDYARRFRKYKKFLLIGTQYVSDFFITTKSASLYDGASYKITLPTDASSIKKAVNDKQLYLNAFETLQISNLRNLAPDFGEFCMRFQDSNIICRLKVSKEEAWLYSTSPKDKDRRRGAIEKYGFSMVEAITYLTIEDELNITGEDAIKEMYGRLDTEGQKKRKEEAMASLQYALHNNTVEINAFPMVETASNTVEMYEILSKIPYVHGDGYVQTDMFLEIARSEGLYQELAEQIIIKTFEIFSQNDLKFSFNFAAIDFINKKFVSFLYGQMERYKISKERVFVEISGLEKIDKWVFEDFVDSMNALKSIGIRTIMDNMNDKNFSFDLMFTMNPYMIKIDSSVVRELTQCSLTDKYEEQQINNKNIFVQFITQGIAITNIKVSAIFVKDETLYNICKDLNIGYAQGYFIAEPTKL